MLSSSLRKGSFKRVFLSNTEANLDHMESENYLYHPNDVEAEWHYIFFLPPSAENTRIMHLSLIILILGCPVVKGTLSLILLKK